MSKDRLIGEALQQKAELKRLVWNRDNRACFYCDVPLGLYSATLDHIKPKSFGGELTYENSVIACEPCNRKRGNMPADIFLVLMMTGGF